MSKVSKARNNSSIKSMIRIYSNSGHIVEHHVNSTGTIVLPKSVNIESIIVTDNKGNIIPFSYLPDTNLGIALTDRKTGEKVNVVVTKDSQKLTGKVMTLDASNVSLLVNGQITTIRNYDSVTVDIFEDSTRPRIALDTQNTNFTLSYLLPSIRWTCMGSVLIHPNNTMNLRLAGHIINDTEANLIGETFLVAGDVYQKPQRFYNNESYLPEAAPMALAASPRSQRLTQPTTSMAEDYTVYSTGNRIIHKQDIAELSTATYPITKLYKHKTNDIDIVQFGYRFIATGFIPACDVNVYQVESNKTISTFLGFTNIEESQSSDEIDLMLGRSTMLQCHSQLVISEVKADPPPDHILVQPHDHEWHNITEELKVEIINHNSTNVVLLLKHYIGHKALLDIQCSQYKNRKNGYLEWYFQVPARITTPQKVIFSCHIVTGHYTASSSHT